VNNLMPQMRRTLVDAAHRHYHEDARASRSSARIPLRGRVRRMRPLVLGGASGVLCAIVAAAVLLSAGGAPSAADAFPILKTPATPLAGHPLLARLRALSAAGTSTAFQTVHAYSVPNFTGVVLQSSDGSTLCMLASPPAGSSYFVCVPTTQAEQTGLLLAWTPTVGEAGFVALVPTRGSVTLTTNGTTTAVPVDANGIASGTVGTTATVSVQVGTSTATRQLTPNTATPSGRPAGAPVGATGSTAATGQTAPTGPTS
jgi:hypothetical protein